MFSARRTYSNLERYAAPELDDQQFLLLQRGAELASPAPDGGAAGGADQDLPRLLAQEFPVRRIKPPAGRVQDGVAARKVPRRDFLDQPVMPRREGPPRPEDPRAHEERPAFGLMTLRHSCSLHRAVRSRERLRAIPRAAAGN